MNQVNETYVEDSARLEACDLDDDDDEHPGSFARKLGLGTQKIREINKKVEEEMGLEAELKRKEADFNKENADPDLSAMEEDDVAKLQNNAVVQLCDGDEKPETVGKKKEKLGTQKNVSEAEARIQRAKEKAAADEIENRRRSGRNKNKNKEDTHTMEKTEDMARKKNLENTIPERKSSKARATGV